ncbi:MAG TPA: alkaline phosphatase family protein [Candidatus Babeliales bacterium]|jgi:predicted AlkP superfamily pyrophosphatase or phosphodiesterase|nr:alkaline phosphatase family protein [Candidatus Babeliales bacterium]
MKNHIVQKMVFMIIIYTLLLQGDNATPRLTLIFVIDQLAYNTLQLVQSHLHKGLKRLLAEGVVFTNAHHPHGMPATCTGHTALSTGAYGNEHGIVGNSWINTEGKHVACDDASAVDAAVLSPDGEYAYGKSFQYGMVDGISDQFVLQSTKEEPYYAYGISLKSRAAIATANRAGIALWFDAQSGTFTSSKAYVQTLPEWVIAFNKQYAVTSPGQIRWQQKYNNNAAYSMVLYDNYKYVASHKPLVNTIIPIGPMVDAKNPYELFMLTPAANQLMIDCATACVQAHINKEKPDTLLLWACISSLDKLGHAYGPWSKETVDMLYHLDYQISAMMHTIESYIDPASIVYVLTSDHGISPIVQQMNQKGFNFAKRIDSEQLIKNLNKYVQETYGYTNSIYGIKGHQLYLNTNILMKMPYQERQKLIKDLQVLLESHDGIKRAWTPEELLMRCFPRYSAENYFKQQLFKNRSGNLIMQVYPYTIITSHPYGTSHKTPYTYNTHVPLIVYQKGTIQKKQIHTKVLTLQLAPTLAQLLHIPQPSCAMEEVLPGILPE